MTDIDFQPFVTGFWQAWRLTRGKRPSDGDEVARGYFRHLQPWPLAVVQGGLQACLGKARTFPKVATWIAELPARPAAASGPEGLRWLHADEILEHARAAALGYHDEPCACLMCQAADVTDRPLRFVPNAPGDDPERAWNPDRARVEVVGHWAHGDELRRWYTVRDAFFATTFATMPGVARLLHAAASGAAGASPWIGENYAEAAAEARRTGRGHGRNPLGEAGRVLAMVPSGRDREPGEEG
jgi:hypothetical protein